MAHLTPIPFPDLVRRMRREAEVSRSIFDLPVRKWYLPDPDGPDLSAPHFSRRASTPVGPAAGPHTQMAQNVVLAWLAGGRIIELKTVQVNDRLAIPRPCIHVPNVGYNVEWSQELRVRESLFEYAKAVYLIAILKATLGFGLFPSAAGFETIFDTSVGYDLEGIRSEKVTGFLQALKQPAPLFDRLRQELRGDLREYRDLELPATISDCVTLSTFHGCPADQIEAIARYLIRELGFHTVIKLNPTLLGFETVRELLHERLGYRHLELRREAFDQDLRYDDALAILRRLQPVAGEIGSAIGAKFTNTLVVANNREIFPTQQDPYMYLSGPPLHVLAMNLMQRCREAVEGDFPVSFSAGIEARNFPAAVACGMVPVTACTDLLRQGGYGRLPGYLRALTREIRGAGLSSCDAWVLAARGHGAAAVEEALRASAGDPGPLIPPRSPLMTRGDAPAHPKGVWDRQGSELTALAAAEPDALPAALRAAATGGGLDPDLVVRRALRAAGRRNGREIVPPLADDRRYHAAANAKPPRRVPSRLGLYDCLNCDLCIPACPNDAIFAYEVEPTAVATERLLLSAAGLERSPGTGFAVGERHQLAVVEAACNECSNCEVYCPEEGAPFAVKERVFLDHQTFAARADRDGFCRDGDALCARLGGREMLLVPDPKRNRATVAGADFHLELTWDPLAVQSGQATAGEVVVDGALLWRMKTVWERIFHAAAPNMVHPDPDVGRAVVPPRSPQGDDIQEAS